MTEESFEVEKVQAEKASAMRGYNRLNTIKKLFRLLELCLFLTVLAWASNRLPFALQVSGRFLRRLAALVSTPLFVFLLSNSIIATLFFTFSGGREANAAGDDDEESELFEDVIKNSSESTRTPPISPSVKNHNTNGNGDGEEEVVYQDKQIISCRLNADSDSDSDSEPDRGEDGPKAYRRTKSEKVMKVVAKTEKELRRSKTAEKVRAAAETAAAGEEEDEMSDEEFQRSVEEFIAKHLMFRRQESLAVVGLQNQREIEAK